MKPQLPIQLLREEKSPSFPSRQVGRQPRRLLPESLSLTSAVPGPCPPRGRPRAACTARPAAPASSSSALCFFLQSPLGLPRLGASFSPRRRASSSASSSGTFHASSLCPLRCLVSPHGRRPSSWLDFRGPRTRLRAAQAGRRPPGSPGAPAAPGADSQVV